MKRLHYFFNKVSWIIFKIEDLEDRLLNIINLTHKQRKKIGCIAREEAKKRFNIEKTSKD